MDYFHLFTPVDPAASMNDTKFEKEFHTLSHSSYEWERAYCAYVRAGDVKGARQYMERIAQSSRFITVGNVSHNSTIQTKFLAVSCIAVVTRVAINSGADELNAYQISDTFLQFLTDCEDDTLIVSELFLAAEQMIQAVHDAQVNTESSIYFIKCREYISSHLSQKIMVEDLAKLCGLTPNYLSHIFKKISGKTITDYILEQKITVAKHLLLSPDYTSAEIATFLGFTSQSYFIACFKKQMGETPRNWKMRHGQGSGVDLYPDIL